ncbi:acetaldehyde dehydrogenase (acetylating) [Embleya sp. NPDC059237]|uniref:acetaldehyde dehydrogenase (acetylating) n=1 Tax=Embleya sp. NPDC059237 TaxID=3346784 RepID=UPI0036744EAA
MTIRPPTLKAAVIGAGMLGIDLTERIHRSPLLACALVAGRPGTAGLRMAARMGCATSTAGIDAVLDARERIDVVFDASNALEQATHHERLSTSDVLLVDLTPGSAGTTIVPTVNAALAETSRHLGLVSCGGQAVLPLLHALTGHCTPRYVEVVTTAASASAGRATRSNLDEYLDTTETAIRRLTRAADVKVLANISPALPAPPFRAQVTVIARDIRPDPVHAAVAAAAEAVRAFAPGYTVTALAVDDETIRVGVEVTALSGGRLPHHAGNVEIINAAAVLVAERHAAARTKRGHR